MTTLSNFEREMKAEARKESDRPTKEHFLSSALAAKALADPVDDNHRNRLVANLRNLATGIATHRQAQGGGR